MNDLNATKTIVFIDVGFQKSDYGMPRLFTLVTHFAARRFRFATCPGNDVPKKFLEQIMLDLKSQGWVKANGIRAGYCWQKNRTHHDGRGGRHFDGILAPIGCVS